ncbi:protease modulator HflC [Ancylobacter dichloromethanicus]|uniref:Protein HflC n=1 Tax=Ancylobacter dichloromethanicus TaxID=518825 RepID=A0A9W6J6S2_9HYPH|nr:protease modulator HflC [Ancylobacter dichloromethanicus]MBS7555258.1 protease modulator HflC [Ancylobacter dichloromethanicus]GLK70439.1 protein HflC [Ancylobacter dichloromethanicus]
MRNSVGLILAILVAAVLIVLYSSLFSVYQTQQALVLRLGEPIRVIEDPGLHAKIPLVDSVILIDNRILDLENPSQEVIASDQKRLVVDAFARYRIVNPLRFYQSVGTIEGANSRLATVLNSSLRRVLGESTFIDVVRDQRENLMARIRDQVNREAAGFGINIIDVRIRRADLPEANSQAVFQRMQTERQREAAEIRAQGGEAAQTIRSRADRDSTIIVAEANATADKLRGEGEALRNDIFAQAYNQDRGFFDFYRSMQAYEASLKGSDTRMLLAPDSEFFRFFGNPAARPEGALASPAAPAAAAPAQPAAPATPAN